MTGASPFASNGERVVFGQRLMQAASDLFLGHMVGVRGRHYFVRQLRDVAGAPRAWTAQAPLPPGRGGTMPRPRGVESHHRAYLGGSIMKFVVGFLAGLVLGAVGAVAYSVQSGRDLREAFDEVRSDLNKRDLEALGSRLEARFAEMQAQLESRIGQVRERATTAVDDAAETAQTAVADAAETAQAAVEEQAGA